MDKVSRKDAKAAGETYYFTGKPCPHGHVCKRFVSTFGCVICVDLSKKSNRKDPEFRARELAYKANYREENRESANEYAKRYWRENPNAKSVNARAKKKNAKKIRAYSASYYLQNKDRLNAVSRRYAKENPDYFRAKWHERRALVKAGGSHTASDVAEILKMQRGQCGYCKKKLAGNYHVDHVTPVSKGGSNDRRNLQCLCPRCNQRKSAKDPIVWAQEIGLLI